MFKFIDRLISILCIFIMIFLVLCVIWQILARWFAINSSFTDELARFLFMWVGLIGAAYTWGKKRHLALDLLSQKLTGQRKKILNIVILILIIIFLFFVMIKGGGTLVKNVLVSKQLSPVLGVPMGYIYLSIPVSGLFMLLYSFQQFFDIIFKKGDE